jgi:Cu/Ag efflux protein CusF
MTGTNGEGNAMRRIGRIVAAVLGLAVALPPPGAMAQSAMVDGQVTKIDAPAGKMTIRHGPLKKLGMDEGMTMVFRVQDPAMLTAIKPGDRIKFDAERNNGQLTVVRVQ